MQSNKIAPKDEVKKTSNPETDVFKDPSLDETSDNPAKPISTIKKNHDERVEVLKNLKCPAEGSKDLVKPKDVDVEIAEKPREVSKEVKHESDKDVVSTEKANVEESNNEENIEVIELMEEQPKMVAKPKTDSDAMKKSKKTDKNKSKGSEEVDEVKQKPSDSNESKNSKSITTKIKIEASKSSKSKELTKSKQVLQKIKQFFVKWNNVWAFLGFVVFIVLFIWLLSKLDITVTRGGVGGTATHSFGSGGGSKDNSDDNNKVTGKKYFCTKLDEIYTQIPKVYTHMNVIFIPLVFEV